VWTYSKEHDLFLIHVFDLKGMQVALARGGGASLVALFCTVCDCTKDVRATLLEGETPVDPAEIRTRVQHFQRECDIPELEEALKSYKPERHQTNASPGADALPGVTPENVAPCLLHCENRMTMQTVQKTWGEFRKIGNVEERERRINALQRFLQVYIYGTTQKPKIDFLLDEATWKSGKIPWLNLNSKRFLEHSEKFLEIFEGFEKNLYTVFIRNLKNCVKLWSKGGCCEHEHEHEHTEGVNVNLKFGDKGNSGHNTNCTFIYTLDAAVWDQIQISGDLVFICSILLWGQKGVYNYTHWLGAGHITFYGKKIWKFRNLKATGD